MKSVFYFAILAIYAFVANLAAQQLDTVWVRHYVTREMQRWQVPGVAVGVVKGDQVLLERGYGVRSLTMGGKVNAHTIFAIASNTKAFTATAIGLLVQQGKLHWDDPVLKYLPDFQLSDAEATRKVTIRDLLCHRVGLATWGGDLTWYGSTYSSREVIYRIRFQPLQFDFRTGFGYSNLMFLVAGEVLQKVSGTSWGEFLKKHFFQPLEMTRTVTSVKMLSRMTNVARPHIFYQGKRVEVPYRNVDNAAPPGAINSCVADLLHWVECQLHLGHYKQQQIVDTAIVLETRTPHTLIPRHAQVHPFNPYTHLRAYGLGWFLMDYRGHLMVYHTGGLDGMFSFVGFLPEEQIGVVVLTNADDHQLMRALAYQLFDALLGKAKVNWSEKFFRRYQRAREREKQKLEMLEKERNTRTLPSHPLKDYAGVYISRLYGKARVFLDGKQLWVTLLAHPYIKGKLTHWQYNTFQVMWSDKVWDKSFLHFDEDSMGRIAGFRVKIRPDWIDPLEYHFQKER